MREVWQKNFDLQNEGYQGGIIESIIDSSVPLSIEGGLFILRQWRDFMVRLITHAFHHRLLQNQNALKSAVLAK